MHPELRATQDQVDGHRNGRMSRQYGTDAGARDDVARRPRYEEDESNVPARPSVQDRIRALERVSRDDTPHGGSRNHCQPAKFCLAV